MNGVIVAVKSFQWLALIFLIAFALLPFATGERVEKYRPAELQRGVEEQGILRIFDLLVAMTAVLVVLRLMGFRLRWLIDLAVFMSGYILGDVFGVGIQAGLLLVGLRKSGRVEAYNLSSALTIVSFSVIFGKFITPGAAMMLMALLSLYDVVGVLYFPYIKFIWLQFSKRVFDGVAILCDDGFIGAGDFALPLLFALSFGFVGILSLPLFALAFFLTSRLSRRFGVFPGLPLQAFFAYAFYLAFA